MALPMWPVAAVIGKKRRTDAVQGTAQGTGLQTTQWLSHVCGLRTMRRYLSGVYLIFRLHQQIAECYDGGD